MPNRLRPVESDDGRRPKSVTGGRGGSNRMPLRALHGARELCRLCAKELPDRASPALAGSRSQVWTLQTVSEGQELQTRQFEVSKYNYHYDDRILTRRQLETQLQWKVQGLLNGIEAHAVSTRCVRN